MHKRLEAAAETAKIIGKYAINIATRIVDPRTILEDLTPDWRFKVINVYDGEIADLRIIPHREFGAYPGGVVVRLVRETGLGKLEDWFYTLDDKGESLHHVAATPFIGTTWKTTDNSWQDLVRYREQIAQVRGLPRNTRRTLLNALTA